MDSRCALFSSFLYKHYLCRMPIYGTGAYYHSRIRPFVLCFHLFHPCLCIMKTKISCKNVETLNHFEDDGESIEYAGSDPLRWNTVWFQRKLLLHIFNHTEMKLILQEYDAVALLKGLLHCHWLLGKCRSDKGIVKIEYFTLPGPIIWWVGAGNISV